MLALSHGSSSPSDLRLPGTHTLRVYAALWAFYRICDLLVRWTLIRRFKRSPISLEIRSRWKRSYFHPDNRTLGARGLLYLYLGLVIPTLGFAVPEDRVRTFEQAATFAARCLAIWVSLRLLFYICSLPKLHRLRYFPTPLAVFPWTPVPWYFGISPMGPAAQWSTSPSVNEIREKLALAVNPSLP